MDAAGMVVAIARPIHEAVRAVHIVRIHLLFDTHRADSGVPVAIKVIRVAVTSLCLCFGLGKGPSHKAEHHEPKHRAAGPNSMRIPLHGSSSLSWTDKEFAF